MADVFTVDASVFVSAVQESEASSGTSREFLQRLHETGVPLFEPTLVLTEVAAAIARGTGDRRRSRDLAQSIGRLPRVTLVPLDAVLAEAAAKAAADHFLRGADAVYVAVAERYGTRLVTLDKEQHARSPRTVKAATPAEALKTLP
ncbi:MAG: type II toxin-antitoxin system VapC family toxin [Deltaproteobacteria bacterium]|nr:type II toxin-antitoxin system VapC family toxin [Deltaproteobacteria bacterium]